MYASRDYLNVCLPLAICFLAVDFNFKTLVDLFQIGPSVAVFAQPYSRLTTYSHGLVTRVNTKSLTTEVKTLRGEAQS
jgi:hypothetical protein